MNSQKSLKYLSTGGCQVTDTSDQQAAAEHLALVLNTHGLQRMTARALATLLFTEQPGDDDG